MKRIPLMVPHVPAAAIESVVDTLRSRWIGQGPRVEQFERRFSELMLGQPCVAVGSCTDALHMSYVLAGIGPGDEVIAPLFTCTATNIPLLYQGAKIRFADVGVDSLNVDAEDVIRMLTAATKAVVVIHYGGASVKLAALAEACRSLGIALIEDCAQVLGGTYQGRPSGTLGDFSCFSFQAVKHVTTGDGGMLVLRDAGLFEKAKRIRWFGIDRAAKLSGTWANDITEIGYKYQMTDISAAMGLAGLDALDDQMEHRRVLSEAYRTGLAAIDGIRILDYDPDGGNWLCTVRVERRDDLRRKLAEHEIESDQAHYRNDQYKIFEAFCGEFPHMDAIEDKYLVLPLHMGMSVEDVERVCAVIRGGW